MKILENLILLVLLILFFWQLDLNIQIDITLSPPNFLVLLITNSSSHIMLVPSTLVFCICARKHQCEQSWVSLEAGTFLTMSEILGSFSRSVNMWSFWGHDTLWLDRWLPLCWKTMKMEAAGVHLTCCVALHPRSPSCWSYFALNGINQLLLKWVSGPWLWRLSEVECMWYTWHGWQSERILLKLCYRNCMLVSAYESMSNEAVKNTIFWDVAWNEFTNISLKC